MKSRHIIPFAAATVLGLALPGHAQEPPADTAKMLEAPSDVAAAPADAEKTASGLATKVITKGTGTEHPRSFDKVTVDYSGWTKDGKLFDSSVKRGQKATFPLNGVIKGWTEGVQLMVVGEKRRFWIPAELAYGESPGGGRPGGMLVFDIELFSIDKGEAPPETPSDVAAAPADAEKTASGLATKVVTKGTGDKHPSATSMATIQFSAWTPTGQLMQSTATGGDGPASIPLDKVFKGWSEGIQLMVKGEKRRMWIPQELGPPGAPGATTCDVELVDFKEPPAPPEVPADVAAAPADAVKTDSGMSSKVLTKGTGDKHPSASSTVKVHYSGWTTDGKMFDSSVTRGEPAEFPLNGVIAGWTEGVQLMVVGEKRRFWIPGKLAYGDTPSRPGAPSGTLVFDVELLEIK
ncbi:MAG: peptidylprolyl isomerase FKBP-type [Akkermansiaceae bacterium]|nr:peptidylprolyl isomerase FKBP-type [Akkermansiaceae bacterium]